MRRALLGFFGTLALGACNVILDIHEHDVADSAGAPAVAGRASGGSGGSAGQKAAGGKAGNQATGGSAGMVAGSAGKEPTGGSGNAGTGGSGIQAGEGGAPNGGTGGAGTAGGGTSGGAGMGGGPVCGNGTIDGNDACDDGNTEPNDGCSATCRVESGWTCDEVGCTEICEDGLVVGDEAMAGGCDDGNATLADGCSNCVVDSSYSCAGQPSMCAKTCGNGEIEGAEGCDDGNTMAGDGCTACAVETGYECDNSQHPSTCADIDECATNTDDCDPNATCDNTTGSYDCTCNDGYGGNGKTCTDIDECTTNADDCAADADCTNTSGSFTCACKPGFTGTGKSCVQNSCNGLSSNCGKAGNENCCTTKSVPGGSNFYRSYNGIDYTDTSFPATISAFHLDKFEVTVSRFRNFVTAWRGGWRPAEGDGKHRHVNGGNGLVDSSVTGTSYENGWPLAWETNVTLTDYDLSCAVSGSYAQPTWLSSAGTAAQEKRAMNCVNWYEAYAFCIWDGNGFMPSEAEWNFAASGGFDYRLYPWPNGTGLDCSKANFNPGSACSSPYGPLVVGGTSTGGDGKYGQADLGGNVFEWVLDSYDNYHTPCTDCASLEDDFLHMVRGGYYNSDSTAIESAFRASLPIQNHDTMTGIRCARP
jgi:cysteine-rich repeat protein